VTDVTCPDLGEAHAGALSPTPNQAARAGSPFLLGASSAARAASSEPLESEWPVPNGGLSDAEAEPEPEGTAPAESDAKRRAWRGRGSAEQLSGISDAPIASGRHRLRRSSSRTVKSRQSTGYDASRRVLTLCGHCQVNILEDRGRILLRRLVQLIHTPRGSAGFCFAASGS
jgi:hypothetical protein